jgi:putative transposase
MLVFLHIGTRRVFATPAATNQTEAWVREQTFTFLQHAKAEKLPVTMLFHDRDSKFTAAVDADLARKRVEVRKTAFRAPNTNAYVERFIQTIQHECLDHFVILGQRHFDRLVTEWLEHYHTERPHQAKDNEPLAQARQPNSTDGGDPARQAVAGRVEYRERLGGLIKHYYRTAA